MLKNSDNICSWFLAFFPSHMRLKKLSSVNIEHYSHSLSSFLQTFCPREAGLLIDMSLLFMNVLDAEMVVMVLVLLVNAKWPRPHLCSRHTCLLGTPRNVVSAGISGTISGTWTWSHVPCVVWRIRYCFFIITMGTF